MINHYYPSIFGWKIFQYMDLTRIWKPYTSPFLFECIYTSRGLRVIRQLLMYADYSEGIHQYSCTVIGDRGIIRIYWCPILLTQSLNCLSLQLHSDDSCDGTNIRNVINHRSEHGSDCQEREEEVILQVARNKYLELAVNNNNDAPSTWSRWPPAKLKNKKNKKKYRRRGAASVPTGQCTYRPVSRTP